MPFDSTLVLHQEAFAASPRATTLDLRDDFRRLERLAVLGGASALGALIGFGAAMAVGRLDLWMMVAIAAPLFAVALHLTAETLRDALRRNAYGCSAAAMAHAAALLAWPITSLLAPLGTLNFLIAPTLAMGTLVLFASCWGGSSRAVYRMGAQGALVAAVAAHQGMMMFMAG